ncbi:hypothetical protein [Streptomyces sp. NPDC014734]|uniref:hypothetical protein n=1 Tax=Streptomyces sp. NPDC014734 TaxID=3364886 RepID=UPI0037010D63
MIALYPTAAVRDQVGPHFPHLPGEVRAFAVDDGRPLADSERGGARSAFTIPADAKAVCVVGGWWLYKDIPTVDTALARLAEEAWTRLFPAGDPDALANALDQLTADIPALPGPSACGALDMNSAADQATFLTDTYTRLTKECR